MSLRLHDFSCLSGCSHSSINICVTDSTQNHGRHQKNHKEEKDGQEKDHR